MMVQEYWYHGTTGTRAEQIKKDMCIDGNAPGNWDNSDADHKTTKNFVYLTDLLPIAYYSAAISIPYDENGTVVLFRLRKDKLTLPLLPDLDQLRMSLDSPYYEKSDTDIKKSLSLQDSLELTRCIRIEGKIDLYKFPVEYTTLPISSYKLDDKKSIIQDLLKATHSINKNYNLEKLNDFVNWKSVN